MDFGAGSKVKTMTICALSVWQKLLASFIIRKPARFTNRETLLSVFKQFAEYVFMITFMVYAGVSNMEHVRIKETSAEICFPVWESLTLCTNLPSFSTFYLSSVRYSFSMKCWYVLCSLLKLGSWDEALPLKSLNEVEINEHSVSIPCILNCFLYTVDAQICTIMERTFLFFDFQSMNPIPVFQEFLILGGKVRRRAHLPLRCWNGWILFPSVPLGLIPSDLIERLRSGIHGQGCKEAGVMKKSS